MKVLHLTLKKKWFDMILSGEKKEEYRDFGLHWFIRFVVQGSYEANTGAFLWKYCEEDIIVFRHGYKKNAPEITIECTGLRHAESGNVEWGWEKPCYGIGLGRILSTKNIINHPS